MNWLKQHRIYEKKTYRIVQKHIKTILVGIPSNNVTIGTYEALINTNITEAKVKSMLLEVYTVIGYDYGNKVRKSIEKIKKEDTVLFNRYLLEKILVFLSSEGGQKIVSIQQTLIEDVVKAIKEQLEGKGSLIDLRDVIFEIGRKANTFYKWQALRIARTETTSASNFAAMATAENSDLELQKEWLSVNDDRTRRSPFNHFVMDGVIVDFDQPFIVNGEKLQYPGDTPASAGNVINCRCGIAFVPKRDIDGNLILKK